MHKILSLPLNINLQRFSVFLFEKKIFHRITEEKGQQIIWSQTIQDGDLIRYYYDIWQQQAPIKQSSSPVSFSLFKKIQHWIFFLFSFFFYVIRHSMKTPITFSIITISLVTTGLMHFFLQDRILLTFSFIDPFLVKAWVQSHGLPGTEKETLYALFMIWKETLLLGQWWRLITPIFLHFSLLHIAFNGAIFIFFGRHIEVLHGRWWLLLLVIVGALISNMLQYFLGQLQEYFFGGLSGVLYSVIGFCWIQKPVIREKYLVPSSFYIVILIFLIVNYFGVFDNILGKIANNAHTGGLITGLILGYIHRKKNS